MALLDSFVSRRSGANAMFQSLTVAWVRLARRAWAGVLALALVAGVAAFSYVRANLGIQTDTADMISPTLDWSPTMKARISTPRVEKSDSAKPA